MYDMMDAVRQDGDWSMFKMRDENNYINITRTWFHDWIHRTEPWGWNNEAWLRDYMYGPDDGVTTMEDVLGAVTDTRQKVKKC